MPLALLKDAAGGDGKSPSVEIWKLGLYLWCDEQLSVSFVVILNNAPASPASFERLRILFPYRIEPDTVKENSALLGDDSYPLNNFKFGPYEKGTVGGVIRSYDGIHDVKILSAGAGMKTVAGSDWTQLQFDYSKSPLRPGETGGLLLNFTVPRVSANDRSVVPHGLTYNKTNASLEFSIRIFDRYLIPTDGPQVKDEEIIPARVLYDKSKRYGGFDINLFVPGAYIDAKTSPDAEYLDVVNYTRDGGKAAGKYTRLVWRARKLYEDHDFVKCGDRMVLSGVFLNPNEMISQLQTVASNLKEELGQVTRLSKSLDENIRKVDFWGKVAVLISVVGLLALALEWDKLLEIFRIIFRLH